MNDLTGMKIDGRRGELNIHWTGNKKNVFHDKWIEADAIWQEEFPGRPKPQFSTYQLLEELGWKFSSKYGWRNKLTR